MKLKDIKRIRDKLDIQLKVDELVLIIKVLEKKPCNFLVFGLGNDTPLWLKVNKKGTTIFIEDLKGWFDKFKTKYKVDAYLVKYKTKRRDWKKLLKEPSKLFLKLSKKIMNTKWDVILVDAPRGWKEEQPGRMQSIYIASKLIKKKGDVFVHDCWREVESVYSNKFLLKKNLVKEIKGLRHYHIK